jgi:hypothetical protein
MLVARRDPPFDGDAQDAVPANLSAYPLRKASKFARFVTAIQMVGSLLAVPVGIASAYSFYRANFSPETTCQSLRSNIVAMLDRSVDAATRRVLVRRDVEAFEKTCGTVDPDATTAFKALLAVDKTAAPAAAAPRNPCARPSRGRKRLLRSSRLQPQPPLSRSPYVAIQRYRIRSGLMPYVRRWSLIKTKHARPHQNRRIRRMPPNCNPRLYRLRVRRPEMRS